MIYVFLYQNLNDAGELTEDKEYKFMYFYIRI